MTNDGFTNLAAAVVAVAIDDITANGVLGKSKDQLSENERRLLSKRQALWWIFEADYSGPVSFAWCCDLAGCSIDSGRRGMLARIRKAGVEIA